MALVSAWLIAAGVSLLAVSDAATAQVTPRVDTLKAELLSQPPAIGQPGFIQPWGKHLLVSDWLGDPNLHVLDRATGELIVSFGRIGRGPGEFPNVLAGVQRPSHDTTAIWVYDARKMTRIEGPGGMGPDVTAIDLTAIPLVLRAAWMDSTTILGVTWEPPERRFVFFDGAGSVIRATSGVLLGHDGIPLSQRWEASAQFAFCMRPDGSRFALLYKRAARVQIYDRSAIFDLCVATAKYADRIHEDYAVGVELGVRGVPTSIVNGLVYEGSLELPALDSAVARALPGRLTIGGLPR